MRAAVGLGLALSMIVVPFRTAGSPVRIVLAPEAVVAGDCIVLAQLLPKTAPSDIRRRAEGLELGRSPKPGTLRTLSREALLTAIRAASFAGYEFDVPRKVMVRRQAISLTRETLWFAVREAAARKGIALPEQDGKQRLEWSMPGALADEDMTVEVNGVTLDRTLDQMRFRLRFRKHPEAPAFYAWLPHVQATSDSGQGADSSKSAALIGPSRPQRTVSPARLATLKLHSKHGLAWLRVRPLEAGDVGEVIRVRVPANGHTLLARVQELDLVEAVF